MGAESRRAEAAWRRRLEAELERRRAGHLGRELRPVQGAQGSTLLMNNIKYVQFCTNNYLGLADEPAVVEAAREALSRYGAGAAASRLVAGSMELHHELEAALAAFKKTEAVLLCSTGFMANLSVLTTFAGPGDQIVSDKLNHASLLDAAKFSGAYHRTFPHRRYARAEELLLRPTAHDAAGDTDKSEAAPTGGAPTEGVEREGRQEGEGGERGERGGLKFLVTDSVFSMDGDVADLPAACAIAERTGALVVIDEAHGTGVLGQGGRGLAELQGVEGRIAVTVGTLSKAFGSVGGFVCGSRAAIDMLINAARSFIYTTALPPATSAASLAALRIIAGDEGRRRRERVLALAGHVRAALAGMGFDCGDSASPIIPVILGEAEKAVRASARLRERGLWVPAIRPPTVPPGTARLRISLMATHSDGQVEALLEAMKGIRE